MQSVNKVSLPRMIQTPRFSCVARLSFEIQSSGNVPGTTERCSKSRHLGRQGRGRKITHMKYGPQERRHQIHPEIHSNSMTLPTSKVSTVVGLCHQLCEAKHVTLHSFSLTEFPWRSLEALWILCFKESRGLTVASFPWRLCSQGVPSGLVWQRHDFRGIQGVHGRRRGHLPDSLCRGCAGAPPLLRTTCWALSRSPGTTSL